MGLLGGQQQTVNVGGSDGGARHGGASNIAACVAVIFLLLALGVAGFGAARAIEAPGRAKAAVIQAEAAKLRAQAAAETARAQGEATGRATADGVLILCTCAGIALLALSFSGALALHTRERRGEVLGRIMPPARLAPPQRLALSPGQEQGRDMSRPYSAPRRRVKVGVEQDGEG